MLSGCWGHARGGLLAWRAQGALETDPGRRLAEVRVRGRAVRVRGQGERVGWQRLGWAGPRRGRAGCGAAGAGGTEIALVQKPPVGGRRQAVRAWLAGPWVSGR